MKVFIASTKPGLNPDPFSYLVPGELVMPPAFTCSSPDCGCDRAWIGMASSRGGTAAEVADLPITVDQYVDALTDADARMYGIDVDDLVVGCLIAKHAANLLDHAARHDIGDVVELTPARRARPPRHGRPGPPR